MEVAKIAAKLRRSEDFIRKLIAQVPTVQQTEDQSDWVARLHSSSFWVGVKKCLMGSEVAYFEKEWARYSDQFSSSTELLATDDLMIRDLVLSDIFQMRANADKTNAMRLISELQKAIHTEGQVDLATRDQLAIVNWTTQVNSLSPAMLAYAKQSMDYQRQKDAKLRDLKGSRDQRFKQIEEINRNIFELLKDLDTRKRRIVEGRMAAKMALSAQLIRDDWNQVMEYEDGTVDKPFLTPEGELKDVRLQNEQEQANRQKKH